MKTQSLVSKPSYRRASTALVLAAGLLSLLVGLPTAKADGRGGSRAELGVPGVRGGVVTTSEPIAAQVGAQVLREGGNAIDAAAAVQFALNVVEPQSSGIGGGGFMLIHLAKQGRTVVVDSRERAPAAADPEMFLQASDGSAFSFGTRSTSGIGVGVPGTLRGVEIALKKWGTRSLEEMLAPAISLAENGINVGSRLSESIADAIDGGRLANEPGDPAYDEARDVFAPGGIGWEEGQRVTQPDLAKTLKLIAENGSSILYDGEIAEAIVKAQLNTRSVADAADQAKLVGRMTLDDLANYEVDIRRPVFGRYRGFKIASMPAPSSGGLTLIQILKLVERFPIGDAEAGFGFGSKKTLNVLIEAGRLAFADRAVWMGDTDFVPDLPVRGLINNAYIATRTTLIDPEARIDTVEAGDPRPFDMTGPHRKVKLAKTNLPDEEGLNTTHFSIVDRQGNVVSYTSTIESGWGTGLMVPGYGFLLNNELTDFNSTPTANADPDNFNPGANDVAPFKRPRSSMSPTIVLKRGRPVAAFGSPGGSTIIWSVANVAMNLIDHNLTVQEAVDAPRITSLSGGGFSTREFGFDDEVIEELRDLGHSIFDRTAIGSVQAVVIDKNRRYYGAADKRRVGGIVSVRKKEIARRSRYY